MTHIAHRLSMLLLAVTLLQVSALVQARPVTVFAASSMTHAIDEIILLYQQRTGNTVRASYAASSSLARQIQAGAPADIFISANHRWMDHLQQQQLLITSTRQALTANRLMLIRHRDAAPTTLRQLPASLQNARLALADSAHVPAGIYARQALEQLHLWQALQPRLASTANVRAALLLVERGEAPYGIVYRTDALLSEKVQPVTPIPETLHAPIIYPVARIKDSQPDSEALLQFLSGTDARAILRQHGFTEPQYEAGHDQSSGTQ